MVENNPHKISTMGTGGSLAAITDGSDFPHSGLIKGLSQMARQNIVVKNNSNDFDITQSTANGGTITVSAGTYLRDGKKYVAQYKTGTTAAVFTFNASELSNAVDKGYHLVVVDVNNFILVRKPTVLNKVPDYTSGDTIIAVFEYASTSSSGAMNIQYLTTDKTENSVSIAYKNSNAYTEVSAITGTNAGLFISGIGATGAAAAADDKVIIQDTSASDVIKTVTAQAIANLAPQGDITGVTAGTGLTGTNLTGPVPTLNVGGLTVAELAASSVLVAGETFADNDTNLMTAAAINDRIESFGYTTNVGDITGVALTAGTGIDLTSVANATAGAYAATIGVDVSDFMANGVNNRVLTATGADAMNAEAGLTVTDALINVVGGILRINKNLEFMPQGGVGFVADTPIMYISDANNSLTLPAASSHTNQVIIIKNMKSANLTITITGGDRFEDNQNYSKDSRWVDVSNVRLLPLQSIRLQAVDDGSIVIPIAGAPDTMATGWMILDSTTINVDTVYTHPNHSGDVTSNADGATTIAADAVTYAKMQNTATANRVLGAASAGVISEVQIAVGMMGANSVDSDQYVDGSIDTEHLAADAVTYAKMQNTATANRVLGAASAGVISEVQIAVGMMGANSVDSDQYVDGSIDTEHLAADAVTYAKMQNVTATSRVLGRITSSAGIVEELTQANLRTIIAVADGSLSQNNFTDADHTKLNGIEASATIDQTASEILTLIEDGVDSVHYKDGSIDTDHIADNQVTGDKLADNIDIAGTLDVTGVTTLDDNLVVATAKTLLARRLPVVALNASTTLTEADHAGRYVFIIGGSRVITLPDNQGAGVHFTIINNDGNGFTLRTGTNSSSGDTMNGSDDDIAVAARNGVTCISTGTDYVVLGV